MSYFKQFPSVPYDFLRDGSIQEVVDIQRSVRPILAYLDDITEYSYYDVKDGERPDIVSQRLYDNPDYYWTFFIINEFLSDGLGAWNMSQAQLAKYLELNFGGQTLITRPTINGDAYVDNINADGAGDLTTFKVGEVIRDQYTQGAADRVPTNYRPEWEERVEAWGYIKRLNVDMNQIVLDIQGTFFDDAPGFKLAVGFD